MSSFYGYSHYYRARYEAERHSREQAQRIVDRTQLHEPVQDLAARRSSREDDTRKGLLMMIAVAVIPVMAVAALVLVVGS